MSEKRLKWRWKKLQKYHRPETGKYDILLHSSIYIERLLKNSWICPLFLILIRINNNYGFSENAAAKWSLHHSSTLFLLFPQKCILIFVWFYMSSIPKTGPQLIWISQQVRSRKKISLPNANADQYWTSRGKTFDTSSIRFFLSHGQVAQQFIQSWYALQYALESFVAVKEKGLFFNCHRLKKKVWLTPPSGGFYTNH